MKTIMQSNIPRCPDCASMMSSILRRADIYYQCEDCRATFKVIGKGKIDNEVLISDNINDEPE
jgi:tRNA(Ile2) C34 agmatinyltransferase TiaS